MRLGEESVAALELRLPTALCHLVRGRNLLGAHFCYQTISMFCCHDGKIAAVCCGGKTEPHMRARKVLPHAVAVAIDHT